MEIQVNGIVKNITNRVFGKSPSIEFIFYIPDFGEFKACASMYLPLHENDIVYGKATYIEKDRFILFKELPFVQISIDKQHIKHCFIIALRGSGFGEVSAEKLYNIFLEIGKKLVSLKNSKSDPVSVKDEDSVVLALNDFASKYNKTKEESLLTLLINKADLISLKLTNIQVSSLLVWWYKNRSLRRLYLIGLNNLEIDECSKILRSVGTLQKKPYGLEELYQICVTNPYSLAPLQIEKANTLSKMFNITITEEHIQCGSVIRYIYDQSVRNAWTCTPQWIIAKKFPTYAPWRDVLIEKYYIYIEYNCWYLAYQYIVEKEISNYITQLISKSVKENEKKVEEVPTVDLPQMESAAYTFNTLADEQKIAIQGALQNNISIITGGPGVGKCLHPDTQVLMYCDYESIPNIINKKLLFKAAKDVKVGDYLIGDDNSYRRVLSTCQGRERMYKIKQNKGDDYIVNESHILSLIYIYHKTKILENNCYHITYWNHEVNEIKRKSFFIGSQASYKTKEEADKALLEFCKSIPDDNKVDVAVRDYLKFSDDVKSKLIGYQSGIEYTEKEVLIDPYILGTWLCKEDSSVDDKLLSTFKKYDLIDNKNIPVCYLINSSKVRLQLLAGLLDTNGCLHNSKYHIDQKNKQLSDDILYLIRSLGFNAKQQKLHSSYNQVVETYHKIVFSGEGIDQIPCKSVRKQVKDICDNVITVECLGEGDYCGFEIDGNKRFLLKDFTVTHNTSVIKEIINNLKLRKIPHMSGSFTGKAVSRLKEVTGEKSGCCTLDRMINNVSRTPPFEHLIIDETSMVTSELLYRFIRAFPKGFRITFVGDKDQLPPVTWGTLFSSLIDSGKVPVYKLTINHRIIAHNGNNNDRYILNNANSLIDPQRELSDPFEFDTGPGFHILPSDLSIVTTIVSELYKNNIPVDDITCITPFNNQLKELNEIFQTVYLSGKAQTKYDQTTWSVEDRVMMKYNNYDIDVMNGDVGKITQINNIGVNVKFDGHEEEHEFKWKGDRKIYTRMGESFGDSGEGGGSDELIVDDLAHCFALTVHKSQGSEYKYVIIYIPDRDHRQTSFLNINLLYTAITRTKHTCWLIASENTISNIAGCKLLHRFDNLIHRIVELNKNVTIFKPVEYGEYNPFNDVEEQVYPDEEE